MRKPIEPFYEDVIEALVSEGRLTRDMRILVVCAGELDHAVLLGLGFTNVIISNLSPPDDDDMFAPFVWQQQDAERLSLDDESVDFCIVHSGLHHCRSPHRGLLEMYRVARRGLLLFEPYDNVTTRLGQRLGFGQDYEHAAVFDNDCAHGGVADSEIPNYVYRWQRGEIVKTIQCFAPIADHTYRFIHRFRIPWRQLELRRNVLYRLVVLGLIPSVWICNRLFPRLGNNFAAVVMKPTVPRDLYPWLRAEESDIVLDREWIRSRYAQPDSSNDANA
jgi:SAM-dependent methyltransferase